MTMPSCSDGIDNDCDGQTDASDSDCNEPPEVCDDGVDNNGNGLVDCADLQYDGFIIPDIVTNCGQSACAATGNLECSNSGQVDKCQPGTPVNKGPYGDPSYSDGIDNDCNNLTDDLEPNCQTGPEICDNNIYDNGDGSVDCAGPLCDDFVGQPGSFTTSLPGTCSAGTTSYDLGETFCDHDIQAVTEGPYTSPTCNDGLDNDCDDLTDGNDPECIVLEPESFCGDDNVDAGEQCDDGNTASNDGCSLTCKNEVCGDGIKQENESCDDGNTSDGVGCESDCTVTPVPDPVCGDSRVNSGGQSDDGNLVSGDGCSSTCQNEVCVDGGQLVITEAEYSRGDEKLHIKGRATSGTTLSIINPDSDKILAQGIRVREGKWEAEIKDVGSILKSISVISSNGCTIDRDVRTDDDDGGYQEDKKEERKEKHNWKRREKRSDDELVVILIVLNNTE